MEYEYKVIDVADGSISSLLLGEGRIETGVLEAYLNAMAAEGWRLKFMETVMQRHLLVSDRETLIVTFARQVAHADREARAARVIDDIIIAEAAATKVGNRAAGAVGGAVVGVGLLAAMAALAGGDE